MALLSILLENVWAIWTGELPGFWNVQFNVHAVAIGVIRMEVSVDSHRGHVRVLDVKRRPLWDVWLEPGNLASVQPFWLVLILLQNSTFVLTHTEKKIVAVVYKWRHTYFEKLWTFFNPHSPFDKSDAKHLKLPLHTRHFRAQYCDKKILQKDHFESQISMSNQGKLCKKPTLIYVLLMYLDLFFVTNFRHT